MSALARYLPVLCALLYLASPIDIIPDLFPLVGWIDDLLLLGLLVFYLTTRVPGESPREFVQRIWFGMRQPGTPRGAGREQRRPREVPPDPYTLLGIGPTASSEEIKAAYRRAVAQYHPDKVAHLAPEFKELAHTKLLAIQQAYETLINNKRKRPS